MAKICNSINIYIDFNKILDCDETYEATNTLISCITVITDKATSTIKKYAENEPRNLLITEALIKSCNVMLNNNYIKHEKRNLKIQKNRNSLLEKANEKYLSGQIEKISKQYKSLWNFIDKNICSNKNTSNKKAKIYYVVDENKIENDQTKYCKFIQLLLHKYSKNCTTQNVKTYTAS